eukprot:318001_1
MAGFVFGLWLIAAANSCDDDCDDDYEDTTIGDAIKYVFQVFIGTGDLGGVVDESIAIVFMVIATLFGTLILTNLLIALMTTQYENLQETAKGEVLYNQAALTYDLSKRSRVMPPPLNIVVLVVALAVYVINFCLAMICPETLNIYSWIDHQLFYNLQNWHIWCGGHDKDTYRPIHGNKTKYKTQRDVLTFYCHSVRCESKCCKRSNNDGSNQSEPNGSSKEKRSELSYDLGIDVNHETKEDHGTNDDHGSNQSYWSSKTHHKACYGLLILQSDHHQPNSASLRLQTTQGITMSTYLERYEIKLRQKVESHDKQLLKRLTANTLFCEHCFRPFLKDNVTQQLSTPFMGSLDFISAIVFVILFPVTWFPLIIVFSVLTAKDWVMEIFDVDDEENENYIYSDFDKEVCSISMAIRYINMYVHVYIHSISPISFDPNKLIASIYSFDLFFFH